MFYFAQNKPAIFVQYFSRKVLTYLQKYAIIISEQGKQKTLENLKGGINMNMMYRFRKNGKEYFSKGENRFDAQLNIELATGKKLNGGEYAEIYKNKVIKTGIIK